MHSDDDTAKYHPKRCQIAQISVPLYFVITENDGDSKFWVGNVEILPFLRMHKEKFPARANVIYECTCIV